MELCCFRVGNLPDSTEGCEHETENFNVLLVLFVIVAEMVKIEFPNLFFCRRKGDRSKTDGFLFPHGHVHLQR